MSVDELKAKGNALFSAGNYDEAIGWFTKAISGAHGTRRALFQQGGVLLRSALYEDALADVRFA